MPLLTTPTKRLHYTDYPASSHGEAKGTVVCHHGLGSSQNFYAPIVPRLTDAGFRVITFDTTGSARSPYTQIEQSVASLANDVLDILDVLLAKEPVIVVGHSMGGIVAAHLAGEHKDRIRALVLLGPVYPSEAVANVFEARIEKVEQKGMESMANTIPFAAVSSKAPPLVSAFIRELLLGQPKYGYLSSCRVIANATRPRYEEVICPVLILAGKEDKSAPLETSKKMLAELGTKDKRLVELDDVGHWHCLEAPDQVGSLTAQFLGSLVQL